jgi:integrase/recombinase XerD
MTVQKAIEQFLEHQRTTVKEKTIKGYRQVLSRFQSEFYDHEVENIDPEKICRFLDTLTEGLSRSTKHLRYAQVKSFYNFIIDSQRLNIKNPCSTKQLFKSYKNNMRNPRKIFDKETIDELIFKSKSERDRLILELQARCGMRIGEVLKIRVSDITGRKIMLHEPKSGRDVEVVFMPERIASRMAKYIADKELEPDERVFKVCYTTVRNLLAGIGQSLGIKISPHDLRRHSATYASRNGVPLEIISKVLLRHADLKTTQIYLGRVSDSEAIRWMDILHGK